MNTGLWWNDTTLTTISKENLSGTCSLLVECFMIGNSSAKYRNAWYSDLQATFAGLVVAPHFRNHSEIWLQNTHASI